MRRVNGLWPTVTSYSNLERAAWRAARAKRSTRVVARFLERLEPELLRIQRDLRSHAYRPGTPLRFEISDPKQRTISAAPFRDRVVHHALIDVVEPHFDRRMVFESFACRRDKGTHAALDHAQRMVRRHTWFLKLDIRKCFESLSHDVVLDAVRRVVKDPDVLGLFDVIVRASGANGRGLPIGNLTSQWLANLALDRLDHHVKEVLRVPGYVRYMDDFVLFEHRRERLRGLLVELTEWIGARLRLDIKQRATILAPTSVGLPFLGWSVFPRLRRLRGANARRTRRRLARVGRQWRRGELDTARWLDSTRSVCAHLRSGNTLAMRRKWFTAGRRLEAADP